MLEEGKFCVQGHHKELFHYLMKIKKEADIILDERYFKF
jgi:hypothetical protein